MKLNGIVQEIIYRNAENNYTVCVLDADGDAVTAVGKFPNITEGECVEVEGVFTKHARFGEQFSVKNVKITPPSTLEGIVKYLSSGLIRGVGPVTASSIVEKFGKDTLEVMEFTPERLAEVRGISKNKALEIAEQFSAVKKMQHTVIFLQERGFSTNLAIKIFGRYGERTRDLITENPYRLVEDIEGIGFYTADKIAQSMGIEKDSEFRLRAGILHILKDNSDRGGHTYIHLENLVSDLVALLKQDISQDVVANIVQKLTLDGVTKFFQEQDVQCVALSKFYNMEKSIACTLQLLDSCVDKAGLDIEDEIKMYELLNNIKMHDNQKEAVRVAVNNGVSVITGGPGTGKTTIVKCILQIYKSLRKRVQLCAPTGRASKRLSESTGTEAMTIHRLLELDYTNVNMFFYNNMNKLPYDVIIIDEVSMVDVQLMYYLTRALRQGTQLILVGDKDQLASVGCGNVLADILASNQFATACLTQIYRQSGDSLIITNAHAINNGKMPIINNQSKDFFFSEQDDGDKVLSTIVSMCTTRIPAYLNIDTSRIQVLAPMKAGVIGIDNINEKLQEKLNPSSLDKVEIQLDKCIFRSGDRIMQISNNYERSWKKSTGEIGSGVFNGDIGEIYDIDINTHQVTVDFEDGRRSVYTKAELSELVLSYAITIHKSQGSEFDAVVIPVLSGPPMLLTKNLLYTAVTRAKKMVVLVGTKQCIGRMVHNNHTQVRYTMLRSFLDNMESIINGMMNKTDDEE
ncbi:MAG: ATP-dependent RecD-like DNA helicase [Clostridiales bacterium]|nr:ATP-dependent RecD-like DNA helicase [Clostridiales bacterium]